MDRAVISGVGMTQFTRHPDRSMKDLSREAIDGALADAGVDFGAVEAVFFGNALAGATSGQHCIRGETVVHAMGQGSLPVTNVENACASSGNALHLAWSAVAGGQYETALAVGAEKMFFPGQRSLAFEALGGALDVDQPHELGAGAGSDRSPFMDLYALRARRLMDRGVTVDGLARLAVKARYNGSLNPLAQKRTPVTLEEVLESRMIVEPLTLLMCAPVGDGAAAAVVTRRSTPNPGDIEILASQLRSLPSAAAGSPSAATSASDAAYQQAGLGLADIDVVEVHDATTAGEMVSWVDTGLCPAGDEEKWAQTGHTELGGPLPVNPSGGLIARGHPIGASGLGQIFELVTQLRGDAGARQVANARVAFVQVGGGSIGTLTAAAAVHILRRV